MPENITVLTSKLTAPNIADTVKRERLLSLMAQSPKKRLTTIVAGAGYGKTTLAAQAKTLWNSHTVWYRLEESDRDFPTFISYLVAGLRKHHPECGTATLHYLRESGNIDLELRPVLNIFMAEIEDIVKDDTIILLDDYHLIKDSPEIKEALAIFLQDLSSFIHLVLISRSETSLPLSRLRSMRQVIDIGEVDLSFRTGEIGQLYSEIFDISLDIANIYTIHHKLGGWIAGLILLCHSLRAKLPLEMERKILHLEGSQKAIFTYLEENVYRALSPEIKDFLIRTSIFSRFKAAFSDSLLHTDGSLQMLGFLQDNHLFTACVEAEEEWYCYHQLFRDFLLSRLKREVDHAGIAGLHLQAAKLLEESGATDEAAGHYLQAEEFPHACRLLKSAGRRLFAEGRFQLLSSYLHDLPAAYLDDYPWMQFLQAQLAGLRADYQEATAKYDQAFQGFLRQNEEEGVQECLIESGLIYFQAGRLLEAQQRFQELLGRQGLDPRLRIEVLGYLIYIAAYLENLSLADRCFEAAIALLKQFSDEALRYECLRWIYYYRGFRYIFSEEYPKVLEIVEYTKAISRDAEPYRYPVLSYLLVSVAYYGLRRYSEGYEAAREALDIIGEERAASRRPACGWHSPRLSPRGLRGFPETFTSWLLAYCARNAIELGRLPEAKDAAAESLKRFRKIGCRLGETAAYDILHRAYLKAGNPVAAEQWTRAGIEAARELTLPRAAILLQLNLAESLIGKGEHEEAQQLLQAAAKRISGGRAALRLRLLSARLYWSENRPAAALSQLLEALELSVHYRDDAPVVGEKSWIVPLLVEALAQGRLPAYIRDLMGRMSPGSTAQLALLQASPRPAIREAAAGLLRGLAGAAPPGLCVYLLGKFRITRNGEEIPVAGWKSRKAKTLLQFLIYSRPRGYLPKEVLMELLWPEGDPEITAKRFHVVLASLRKILEPGIVRGRPSAYISRSGDAYRIDLGEGGGVDLEIFTAELRRAREDRDPEKAIAHCLQAESLYGGDFLAEDLYSDWCSEAREKYRKDYLSLTKRLMDYYEGRADYAHCLVYAGKYLQIDNYAEDVYRLLMRCYWETGDKFGLTQTFRKCRDNINNELNCSLSRETEQLYRQLASSWRS